MTTHIEIGQAGKKAYIDLDVLLRTRLLVQANSGGGKSWVARRLAEQLFGHIPIHIIDPEGEFATLREKFGFVLVGKGGELSADPRYAETIAHKLLELRASAVYDLYELKPQARHHWVKLFLEALIDAPKNLWRPTVVMIDECHVYSPEKGQGESEAFGAVQDLVTRGRKRGLCPILFTQRLSKLSKNVSAECLNRLVGMTFEDVDLERAADLLSVPRSDRLAFYHEMKNLEPGSFWGLGRAISKDRILIKVGPVSTTHPEMGAGEVIPPPPPEKIKALLPKLAALPKEAEEKARTEAELRAEIRSLKAQVAARPKVEVPGKVTVKEKIVEVPVISEGGISTLKKLVQRLEKARSSFGFTSQALEIATGNISRAIEDVKGKIPVNDARKSVGLPPHKGVVIKVLENNEPHVEGDLRLLAGERRMLEVLSQFRPGSRTRSQLGALSGYTPSGGTFANYFGRLKRLKFLEERGDGSVTITDMGVEALGGAVPESPTTTRELLDMWRSKLLAGERKMLDVVVEYHPHAISKEDLGEKTGYTSTGGTFANYLGTLRRNGLVEVGGGCVEASKSLFELG